MKKLWKSFKCVSFYVFGHFLSCFMYDKKYLTGMLFRGGRFHWVTASGWRLLCHDAVCRILLHPNKELPWPISYKTTVTHPENIEFDPDDILNFHAPGAYFQAIDAKAVIKKGTFIAPNVGLSAANHDPDDLTKRTPGKSIKIGKNSLIEMNAVLLPGVELGARAIVGADEVLTKSFPEGNCVLAGNSAEIIRTFL